MTYDFNKIEKNWQNYWDENQTFKVEEDSTKQKYYVLDMFPYPSGKGLHVGHPEGYTATDIVARYKRMIGLNVLHPMGWDSFGLPAENHALKTGVHPEITTEKNIQNFKRQLKMLGFSYDWSREVRTSSPDYYRWTQWIFTKLYEKGLAYESEILVNWCPALGTVLANEEVIDGKSEVGNHPVFRKPMKQWVLKITDYADRLLEDLDGLDWPENVKEMQKLWIGKSIGAVIRFEIDGLRDSSQNFFEVFTTRADTLFGSTFIVLAPEHPLVDEITTLEQKDLVISYRDAAQRKSDLERTELNKDKTGVFLGSYAKHPCTGNLLPVWIADYVMIHYGKGAVMCVPGHDERDYEFAQKYDLEICAVVEGGDVSKAAYTGEGKLINSDFLNELDIESAKKKMIEHLVQKGQGYESINYKLRDWPFSRQRYWGEPFPVIKFEDGSIRCLDEDELPVILPKVDTYEVSGTGESPLVKIRDWVDVICPKTGKKGQREVHTMPQWAGSCWYYLRFCDPQNSEEIFSADKVKYWMPVDLYVGGAEHAVLHLLYSRFWHKVLYDIGLVDGKEPFQKLVNQGMILGEDGQKMSKSLGNIISPDDVVAQYGADTLRIYEMFMGPLEKSKPWSMNGVKGVFNFLNKAFRFFSDKSKLVENSAIKNDDILKLLHQTIKKVTSDIEQMKFNTAVSQLMIFVNESVKKGSFTQEIAKHFSLIVSPFAPHMGEELWKIHGGKSSLAYANWPKFDEKLAVLENITMAVQINGKTRATLDVSADISKDKFLHLAKGHEKLQKYFDGEIIKEIYVPKRICNFIIRPKKA